MESFPHVKLREDPRVAINVRPAIRREEERHDRDDSGRVRGKNFSPRLPLSGGEVEADNFGRKLAVRVHEEATAVVAPAAKLVIVAPPGNWSRLASIHGIDGGLPI